MLKLLLSLTTKFVFNINKQFYYGPLNVNCKIRSSYSVDS